MKIKLKNFIIESDNDLYYFNEIVHTIIENEINLLSFFKLEKLPNKVNIKIQNYDNFKDFITSKYGEIQEYVVGDSDSKTNTIRLLEVSDQIKYTAHKDASIDSIKETLIHEMVHQFHHTYHLEYKDTVWFAEGLACYLANQPYEIQDLNKCDFNALRTDFRHYPGNYKYSYTIVSYIFNNYLSDEIEKLYKDLSYLRSRSNDLFEEAKIWSTKRLNKQSVAR